MYRDQFESLNRGRLNWQTEEEVRLGWLTELQNKLAITFHAERGRSDADYNQVIIEFKNVGLFHHSETSPKFLEALEELSRYISAKAQEDNIDIQNYQGIAIDGESIAFVYMSQSGGVFHGPIMPLSPASVQMVFEACHNSSRRSLTASNLIEDFGHGSITGGRLMQALSNALMSYLGEYVEQNMETAQMLNNLVAYHMVSNEEKETWGDLLSTTYSHVLDLHRRNWNGIWFRIVRNYFWSATTGEFDVVVGNPPWVRWSKLPELYRSRVTPTCRRYDIFSNTPFYGGNELDISGLITYTVSDKWLKTGGQLIFLLTQTHFQSASSEGFRRFCIDGQNYLTPIEVEDLKELKPFSGAANKTVIFVAQKGENRPTFPINYTIWKSIYGLSKIIPEYATKQDVLNRTVREENEANPVQDSSSPWVILPHGEFAACQKLIGTCTWAEGRKGITCDLNGVYFVNVVDVSHDRRLVRIETRPEAGRTNIGHRQKFWIEADLLYPVIKGAADIAPCCFNPNHELYAIVPNRGITPAYFAETQNVMVQENPRLFEYFHHFERQLRNRSTYKTRMPTAPYYAIYNVGGYTFAPWKVVWPEQPGNSGLPVAVVNTRTLRGIGERLVIPDHKIYFAGFDEASKAFYLCGLLLCSTVQRFILSFHIMLQVGDIFKHMKLPEYDPTNGQHFLLAKLVKEAHTTTDKINRQTLLEQISNIGNSIIENWNLL